MGQKPNWWVQDRMREGNGTEWTTILLKILDSKENRGLGRTVNWDIGLRVFCWCYFSLRTRERLQYVSHVEMIHQWEKADGVEGKEDSCTSEPCMPTGAGSGAVRLQCR